jgi:mono/diheme cytochrome c family protein
VNAIAGPTLDLPKEAPRVVARSAVSRTLVAGLLGLSLLAGCSDTYPENLTYPVRSGIMIVAAPTPPNPPTQFDRPGEMDALVRDIAQEMEAKRQAFNLNKDLADAPAQYQGPLDKVFGTPAHPTVNGIEDAVRNDLQLQPEKLALGSKLYRQHCLHCHGLTGDGRGPTASWVNPHPRDYRRGIFKYSSSSQPYGVARKPRRQDLLRTLQEGLDSTSMPSFRLLPADEQEALVSYVIHLSIRGEAELNTMVDQLNGFDEGENVTTTLAKHTKNITRYWWESSFAKDGDKLQYAIEPGPYPNYTAEQKRASVQNGFRLFVTSGPTSASCISCHKDYGRQSPLSFDEWGTIVRPLDLTAGIYRGGRRPIDVYYRIHSGINGSGMTAFKDALKAEEIWDLVNFLQALPYPQMLPDEIRSRVYSEP